MLGVLWLITLIILFENKQFLLLKSEKSTVNFANRGMSFEAAINETNNYYLSRNIAVIHKNQHRFKLLKLIIRKEAVPKL